MSGNQQLAFIDLNPRPQFRFNEAVTLVDDSSFLGYYNGTMVDDVGQPTGELLISVKQPGKQILPRQARIARERVVPVKQ